MRIIMPGDRADGVSFGMVLGKFALKSALYGAQGVVSLPDKLINMASEGSYKAALNTNMDKFVGDLDQQIGHASSSLLQERGRRL